jgi:hypothetical protein
MSVQRSEVGVEQRAARSSGRVRRTFELARGLRVVTALVRERCCTVGDALGCLVEMRLDQL